MVHACGEASSELRGWRDYELFALRSDLLDCDV